MNLNAIALVQETLAQVEPLATAVAFYDHLFALDPGLRPLFTHDPELQGVRFLAALQVAVNGLSEPELMVTAVKQLGKRHVAYGVRPEHYHTFGKALFWTLEQQLGDRWTPTVAAAWTEAYYLLAGLMKEAATRQEIGRLRDWEIESPNLLISQSPIPSLQSPLQTSPPQQKSDKQHYRRPNQPQGGA